MKCTSPNYHTHPQNHTHISSPKTPEVSREAPPTVIANALVRKYAEDIIPNNPVARMQCIMKVETRNSNQNKCPIKKRTEVLNFLSLCIWTIFWAPIDRSKLINYRALKISTPSTDQDDHLFPVVVYHGEVKTFFWLMNYGQKTTKLYFNNDLTRRQACSLA